MRVDLDRDAAVAEVEPGRERPACGVPGREARVPENRGAAQVAQQERAAARCELGAEIALEREAELKVYPGYVPAMQGAASLTLRTAKQEPKLRGWLETIAMQGESEHWRVWATEKLAQGR